MEDFFVQECCVHGTDLENHGPTSILCDDPLPIESNNKCPSSEKPPEKCILRKSYFHHSEPTYDVRCMVAMLAGSRGWAKSFLKIPYPLKIFVLMYKNILIYKSF